MLDRLGGRPGSGVQDASMDTGVEVARRSLSDFPTINSSTSRYAVQYRPSHCTAIVVRTAGGHR